MPDMLVKLYELPDSKPLFESLRAAGIDLRRSIAPEKHHVTAWVRQHFSQGWQSETEVSYSRNPVSCWVATQESTLLGFACYDVTAKGFFGPTGVDQTLRGKGIGKALLFACLEDMRAQGYGYAIIGAAGPVDFYAKAVNAVAIPDSWPGVYKGMLRDPQPS